MPKPPQAGHQIPSLQLRRDHKREFETSRDSQGPEPCSLVLEMAEGGMFASSRKKATSRWSDHAAAEATSLASPILNSRKGISIYRRGATLLARKMQPDHLKELAERLYDLRDTARIIPLAQVEIGDGSAGGDWSPFPRFSHDNVNIWVRRSPEYKAVRVLIGPFLPSVALHQFDRCWARSGHRADIVNRSKMTLKRQFGQPP